MPPQAPPQLADPIGEPSPPVIPGKLYFRIGEVSRIAGIKPYVLRFWESEFPALGPKKSGAGQRLYRRKDVELILQIKQLLYEKRYTIEGARKAIQTARRARPEQAAKPAAKTPAEQGDLFSTARLFDEVRKELAGILNLLS